MVCTFNVLHNARSNTQPRLLWFIISELLSESYMLFMHSFHEVLSAGHMLTEPVQYSVLRIICRQSALFLQIIQVKRY